MAENSGILVFGEVADDGLSGTSKEILGKASEMAGTLGESVVGVVAGDGAKAAAEEMIAHGAGNVYCAEGGALDTYDSDLYTAAIAALIGETSPSIVLMAHSEIGRDLGPRLAFRLDTGIGTDCTDLNIDPESNLMVQTRPVYGGNAQAQVVVEDSSPQMATVRAKTLQPSEHDDSLSGEIVDWQPSVDASVAKTKIVDRVKAEAAGMKLEEAPAIIAGGRGVGSAEAFQELAEVAKSLGGLVGATRAACDSGYISPSVQIGITGRVVSPDLYIAVALSGASQHMSGCLGSKVIVAVNKDADANVFKDSRYGAVGDFKQVMPAFHEKCKELLASS